MVSWWVQYLDKSPRSDLNNGQRDNLDNGRILAPSIYPSPIGITTPPKSCNAEEDYHSWHYRRPFDFTIFPPKCYEASFKRAQSVNKNCLTTLDLGGFTSQVKNDTTNVIDQ